MRRNARRHDQRRRPGPSDCLGALAGRDVAVVNGIERAAEDAERHRFLGVPLRRGGISAGL